ncbi:54S ribosomal protein L28 [Kluyveromyces marxianus]|uniref:Large ribosomal subunit protein mL40 n=2 Tax=Kluyveromyces marxianus TaxID=4911 RepID=W0T8X0_KLUMD|nr:54S ribosomal protein L28 [Kluyveromyces marxianus DMKU3-1042]KAG0679543.1 39S ribosomal protein L28, mitochondrial [Kluyveromyces marxianus]KAG0685755.1 39S ribosomal protein L28, mitochondrial [Kluyveromyces marxianus]QGN15542.1 54S ribosomal protein L28 [Kluyveromyces marxianus]BAO39830.1 54S ribosomal protein L28 [Kluyveromyces marxianus DMKU3-1042]BAP71311.1 54S ribosomal protein L28 [Kluyveromyces marxianus]
MILSPASSKNVSKVVQPSLNFIRGKRTKSKGGLNPQAQRIITQLSVLSASRKQPKLLKLSREDLIKHDMIQACWSQYQRELREKRENQLRLQYEGMEKAMSLLEQVDPELYAMANAPETGKRFPLELRVPTEYPPNTVWYYDYKKKE